MPTFVSMRVEYVALTPRSLAELLVAVDYLFKDVYCAALAPWRWDTRLKQANQMWEYQQWLDEWLQFSHPEDRLQIESIETGHSVLLRFKGGWKPTVRIAGQDVEIGLPSGLALPLVFAVLLFGALHASISTARDCVEFLKSWREADKVLKEDRKLDLEIRELQRRLENVPSPIRRQLDQHYSNLKSVYGLPDFTDISVTLEPDNQSR